MTDTAADPLARLAELGYELPTALTPNATYVPTTQAGKTLYVSGQLAFDQNGQVSLTGRLGAELSLEAGQECARRCALSLLAHLRESLGDLGRVEQILKLHVYVAAAPSYSEHHKVANGASDLLGQVLGSAGIGARSAFGVSNLPFDSPVEIDAIVQVSAGSAH
jgi:enamine deaminase RidA (YjgF/YER057c/UK114 family)